MKAFWGFEKVSVAAGAIPVTYKELIAVAVALTTQCPYCMGIHTGNARKAGASDDEIVERRWRPLRCAPELRLHTRHMPGQNNFGGMIANRKPRAGLPGANYQSHFQDSFAYRCQQRADIRFEDAPDGTDAKRVRLADLARIDDATFVAQA